jgi:hypothetical protein
MNTLYTPDLSTTISFPAALNHTPALFIHDRAALKRIFRKGLAYTTDWNQLLTVGP